MKIKPLRLLKRRHPVEEPQHTVEASQHPVEMPQCTVEASQHPAEEPQHTVEASQHPAEASQNPAEEPQHTVEVSKHSVETPQDSVKSRQHPVGIQQVIMTVCSAISISVLLISVVMMYVRSAEAAKQEMIQSSKKLMEQSGEKIEDYLYRMRQVSDVVYYNVIKENDFSENNTGLRKGMSLLYETNKDSLKSIAIYNRYGRLLQAEPVAKQKQNPDVTQQDWFLQALDGVENMHFSVPHIQNLFDDGTFRYYWVISLSRVVEITSQGDSSQGVLLVDMDYADLSRMMKQINHSNNGQYYYLCDRNGEIIYHPKQIQVADGIFEENNNSNSRYKDGIYEETFQGQKRKIIVNTISYTGWKLIGIIPYEAFTYGMMDLRYFLVIFILVMMMVMVLVNRLIADRISRPILKLDRSVMDYEAGKLPKISIGGPQEIAHLGGSIQKSYEQIESLMKKIVKEQNERRINELEALQSQINPHFLYNTLESIMWMVEDGQNDDAVFMISQLSKLFRISLSKGHTVISVKDEMIHAKCYVNIQKARYKKSFTAFFDIPKEMEDFCIVKLILQPMIENAISYGIEGIEECGEIRVTGERKEDCLLFCVADNGIGMTREDAGHILQEEGRTHARGSGVGLTNVNNRIRLLFGKEYGIWITSEPDEGTQVWIRIPVIPFTEKNRKSLEKGTYEKDSDSKDQEKDSDFKDQEKETDSKDQEKETDSKDQEKESELHYRKKESDIHHQEEGAGSP